MSIARLCLSIQQTISPHQLCKQKFDKTPHKTKACLTTQLPPASYFGSADMHPSIDGSASCNAMQSYNSGQIARFSLNLSELLHEVWPSDGKISADAAVAALHNLLQPVKHAVLASAQLMKQKQGTQNQWINILNALNSCLNGLMATMQAWTLNLNHCWNVTYSCTQVLFCKWQEKILPSAATFHNVLSQACAAKEQEHTLSKLHGMLSPKPNLPHTTSLPPKRTYHQNDHESAYTNLSQSWRWPQGACFSCGKLGYQQKDSPPI